MSEKRFDEKAIFKVAFGIESIETRNDYLDQVCGDNHELFSRVTKLLRIQEREPNFLEVPVMGVVGTIDSLENKEQAGTQIGPYKLIEQIGEGGMGVVYMAAQKEPVRRMVALKVIKAGMDTQHVVARFEAERQAMAMLNHPNIAKVLDAGATEAGRPYFVMELVKGAPITEFCDTHKLDTKHRLQLFITICQAVQHAHQKGLIHRDIKPSNVMVEMHDVTPVPKVIDFGVAKAIGHQLTEKTLHSGFHQMVGTPLYMSPEQIGQSSIDIDTRSDIYSLGVLLYEILTGHTPFESEILRNAGYDEMRRMIREVDPPRPSLRVSTLDAKALSTISDNRNVDARKLSHQLRGELDWIVMMALEKDRNRRYDTANEFADDVQRFLNDEAVHACPPSAIYRFRKLASRNRASLSAATLVAATLVLGTAISVWQAMQARDAKAQTEIAKQQLDDRYRIAKEAVDTYLLRVSQDERLDHPSFRQLRNSLLEAALPYYDQLHAISPTDEQSRAARAETLNQLGNVKQDLGRFDESLVAFEESAKLFDRLATDNGPQFAYRQSLAKVLTNLADHYRTRGATSESLEYEQHALALRQQLVSEHPDNDLLRLELAQSYTNVGVGTQENSGRDLLEQAIEIWQDFAQRFPERSLYREYLSFGYQNLAHRFAWDHAEEAIPFHEFAIDLLAQLAKEQPESKKAQLQWAQSHQYLAATLEKLSQRLDEAREHCEESIRILQACAKKHPQWPEVKSHLATTQNKLAHTLKELGVLESAYETCESSLLLWEKLVSEYPDMLEYQVGLAEAQHNASSIVVAQGQAVEGMSMLTKSRDSLLEILDRIGPHERSNELLRTINSSLADIRKVLSQEPSSEEEFFERKTQTAGEALRPSKFLTDLSNSPTHGLRVGGMASSLTQTEEQDQSMKRLRNKHSRSASRPQIRNERPLAIEPLESRQLLATLISVSNAMMNEIESPSAFVTSGSGGLQTPSSISIGSDGNVYVAANGGTVLRYHGTTGANMGAFVSQGSGGLSNPGVRAFGIAFGPDSNLYVASGGTNQVLKFNGTTGAFVSAFVTAGSGGLNFPRAVTFGSDGNLYVTSRGTNSVMRYQGPNASNPGAPMPANGQSGATFVAPNSGGLLNPLYSVVGPDGNLYVNNTQTSGILRYDGITGAPLPGTGQPGATFISDGYGNLAVGRGMAFDADGRLNVVDSGNGLHRYDAQGNFLGDLLVNSVSSSIADPLGLAFDTKGALLISSSTNNSIVRYDRGVIVSLSEASPSPISVNYATADGSATMATKYYPQIGKVTFAPGQTSRQILLATKDNLNAEPAGAFSVNLSNATGGAVISVGTGTVTINDDDTTRTLSIADNSAIEGNLAAHYRGAFVTGIPGNSFNPLTFGPDGNFYTSVGSGSGYGTIGRYNGNTGVFLDTFIKNDIVDHPLNGIRDIVFRGDYVYVANAYSNEVLRYNAITGAFVDVFVTAGSGGIIHPDGMIFGPDANNDGIAELYVTGWSSHNIVRYDGVTGQPISGSYIGSGSGGLNSPFALAQRGNELFVTSAGTNQILKYNVNTGAYIGIAASGNGLAFPGGVTFGTDDLMYVSSMNNNRLMRFTPSGVYVDDYVQAGTAGMDRPRSLRFNEGDLYLTAVGKNEIMRFGTQSEVILTVTTSTPSTLPLTLDFSTVNGSAIAGSDYVTTNGTVTFWPGVTSTTIRIPILDDTPPTVESTEVFFINLSNPVAATIADGQAIVSIIDNDPFTKFYVVNDASTDGTYEYETNGTSIENYALAAGNTAPRGAASSIAGTTVWVVDANKSVYSYDTSGALKGSWAAGGLQTNAQLEGIATNDADVWLVDNRTDKVYRYAKAAPLTNGSPVPVSSFSLNRSNTSPKDIVTDGNYLWVLNDSSIDKVFKYTIGGTFVGSWTIATSGASSPTGITLDPSKPSAIWIVDNGTDKVYQYDAAVDLTSGNKSANSSWALAAGNSNPQGIADPPPPASRSVDKTGRVQSPPVGPVPMPWFSNATLEVAPARLDQAQATVRSTDKFMSVVGLALKQPTAASFLDPFTSAKSYHSTKASELNEGNIQDDDMETLIGLVANNFWK